MKEKYTRRTYSVAGHFCPYLGNTFVPDHGTEGCRCDKAPLLRAREKQNSALDRTMREIKP